MQDLLFNRTDIFSVMEGQKHALKTAVHRLSDKEIEEAGDALSAQLIERFSIVHWPVQELNGLATREVAGKKVILPIWHKVDAEAVRQFSPMLADRKAAPTANGLEFVIQQILEIVKPA